MITLSTKSIAFGSSLAAGLLWGGWAFIANINSVNVWISVSAQFISSITLTSIISVAVYKLSKLFDGKLHKIVAPAAIASSITIFVLAVVHYSVGTENLLLTLSAPSLIGLVYSLLFSYSISKTTKTK